MQIEIFFTWLEHKSYNTDRKNKTFSVSRVVMGRVLFLYGHQEMVGETMIIAIVMDTQTAFGLYLSVVQRRTV